MFVLFNKDKEFIGYSEDIPPSNQILTIETPPDKSDLSLWKWEGSYDTGGMIRFNVGYPEKEIELENDLKNYIQAKYPIDIQILNIIQQINKILENNDSLADDDFVDMSQSILNAIEKTKNRINYYKAYHKNLK